MFNHTPFRARTAATIMLAAPLIAAIAIPTTASAAPASPTSPTPPAAPSTPAPRTTINTLIDVSALPLASTAKWKPITGHTYTASVLYGIAACSPNGKPVPSLLDPRASASGRAYVAPLVAGADTQGWSGFISAATYPSMEAASYGLNSYRRYLDNCPLADNASEQHNAAAGTSSLDPTTAHAIIATKDRWIEVFAVATPLGVVEAAFTKPNNGPIGFGYNPRGTFAALKAADLVSFTSTRR